MSDRVNPIQVPVGVREHCPSHVPIETTIWYCSNAALRSSGKHLSLPRGLGHLDLVKYIHHQPTDDTVLDAASTTDIIGAPWVFRVTAQPRPRYALENIVRAATPCICSVIFATLWVVLVGNTQTAVTFVSFIFMANVGVLILLGILCMCEN